MDYEEIKIKTNKQIMPELPGQASSKASLGNQFDWVSQLYNIHIEYPVKAHHKLKYYLKLRTFKLTGIAAQISISMSLV